MLTVSAMKMPHLISREGSKQLVVDGQPFLVLGGELQNSSLTSSEYMDSVWQRMVDMNVNTLLGAVTWEMVEPVENKFVFGELDKVILGARKHALRLVLLWFGSFKNGLSTYTPGWVKKDIKRFPRAKLRKAGGVLETADVLSVFHDEGRRADAKAFAELMKHIKQLDEHHSTVVMVQVENESGLLGDSRDGCPAASKKFSDPVPSDLSRFLRDEWSALHPDLTTNLAYFKGQPDLTLGGDWETVFGKGRKTDELFMAYHYAQYVDAIAAAGKAAYPIPMYTNVWMNSISEKSISSFPTLAGGGQSPGEYPSGGATSNVLDIWQKFAPSLDFISPDIYLSDYTSSCSNYCHRGQPLFIPEQRRDDFGARHIWIAVGSYAAIGVAPFGIDTLKPNDNVFPKHYGLLKLLSPIILDAQRRPGSSVGFCFDEISEASIGGNEQVIRQWDGYEITIERAFVFGKPGPGAGMVINRGGGVFLLIGWGFQVRARALSPNATFTGILRVEEKTVSNSGTGELRTVRILNGDETRSGSHAVMPNEDPDYGGFPISITIPARTMIAEMEVYYLDKDQEYV